jgi:uncharacterized protein (DUF2141 family)
MQYRFFILLIILISLSNCARVGRPTGGKKDILPPVTISASPDFGTLNFNEKKIKIYFNEFIKFKDLNKQLVVSPPLNYRPEITPLGSASKTIIIKIKDTLKENTTYTFNFGNAIVDNSESNPLKQFKYLFSTGNYIDSLSVSGFVKDAFFQKTTSDVSVLIYAIDSIFNDSIIYKRKPDYIANTLDSIAFTITNIKEDNYLLIALKDKSNNMLFNPKEDLVAFIESPINVLKDSIYQLNLFKEKPEFSIRNTSELSKNHIVIGYEGLLDRSIKSITDKNDKPISYFSYNDRFTDSLHIWYKDVSSDSLSINWLRNDSLISSHVRLRSKDIDSLQLSSNIQQTLHLRDSLFIISNIPIGKIDKNQIKLIDKDSLKVFFKIIENSRKDRFQIDFEKKYSNQYSLILYPATLTDFLGQVNDTIHYSFNTKKIEDYGEINLKVGSNSMFPLIIELISNSGKTIAREFIESSKTLNFSLLLPGKYSIRAIHDENNNKQWDTGNYLKKIQPEKIFYYSKEIEVRANWTISEEFILK